MKISNKDLAILVILFIFLTMINIFPQKTSTRGLATDSANATITVNIVNSLPEILSYYPLINPNITEEESQLFNVSFTDIDDPELKVEWGLGNSTVKEETKEVPGMSEYVFVADYASAGQYNVTVSVSDISQSVQLTWEMTVTNVNRPPYFYKKIKDMVWYQGSTHTMDSLDNYATDPDLAIDDTLSYEIIFVSVPSQIRARIDQITHEVLFISNPRFVGSEIVYFKVIDSWGAFNYSNNVTLTVLPIPSPAIPKPQGGGGRYYEEICENYWYCGSWSKCDPITNTRERECIDLANCPVARDKPNEIENCTYIPTCYDGIKNSNEIGIDCGGECPPCWTCYDGIKNQGEEGIDCGGPCIPCPTCDDGKRNCQRLDKENVLCEYGVDCGGPCPNKDCCTNNYSDSNLGEQGIDCGGPCKACELMAPVSHIEKIVGYGLIVLTVVMLVISSTLIVKEYRKRRLPQVTKESVILKDLKKMYEGLNKLEKVIENVPIDRVVKLLSYATTKIMNYRFGIDLSCTEKEIIDQLSKIKKENVIKNTLMHIYSKLYYSKYSGQEISKDELLRFIKQIEIINYLTIKKFYLEQKRKQSLLAKKSPFFAKVFYHFWEGKEDEISKRLEQELKHDKKEKIKEKDTAKLVSLLFVILTVAMVFSLFIIPKPVSKYGFAAEKGIKYELSDREIGEPRDLIASAKVEEERTLLSRIIDWIIKKIRIVGMAGGPAAPQFVNINNGDILTSAEDSNASFLIQASDDGDDPLIFSFLEEEVQNKFILKVIPPSIVNNDYQSAWVNFTPTEEFVYDSNKARVNYTVTIVVKDSLGNSDSIYVIFNVTNVNDAPNIQDYLPTSLNPSVYENSSITFWFNNDTTNINLVADSDLIHPGYDSITNEWYFNGVLNNTDISWSYTPGFCDAGKYNVTLIVTDSYNLAGNLTWESEVLDLVRPPLMNRSFVGYEYIEWVEGSEILNNVTLAGFFEDSDAVECSEPTNMTFGYETISLNSSDNSEMTIEIDNVTSEVSFRPSENWFGVQVIRYYADNGAKTYSEVNIILNVTNVYDPPVLQYIPDQPILIDSDYFYDVDATDPDNDVLYFSDNSTLFDINESTGVISFIATQEGNYSIEITVNDSLFTDSQVVVFTIYREGEPPNITMIYPYGTPLSNTTIFAFNYTNLFPGRVTSINAIENITILFNQTSYDPENDPLTCSWYLNDSLRENNYCANKPYWIYEINFSEEGIKNLTLVVEDDKNNKDLFSWNITIANLNRNPAFGKKFLTKYEDFNKGTLNQTSITEELGNITLGRINPIIYYQNGNYISPVIDLKGHYDRTNIKSIMWKESRPEGTNITFRVRTASTAAGISSANWGDLYYNSSIENMINSINRYMQFEVNMITEDTLITPKVEEIEVNYEIRSMGITGNYQAWIDLDDFFDDSDGIETLNYTYEDIFGASILGLIIENESNIISLYPVTSGRAEFRFIANDSYSLAYSNNITLDVRLETDVIPVVSISSGGGGGGGGARRKIKIVPVPEVEYQQLIFVEPLEVLGNGTFIAPLILRNTGKKLLNDIYLRAETDMENVSFSFERGYIPAIDIEQYVKTKLYIIPSYKIEKMYTVDVIANVNEPKLEDVYSININPLENITEKIELVSDLLQLNPICRELEEMVIKARVALNNNQYEKSDQLLTEVIEGCKYLIAVSTEKPTPKLPFVLKRRWIFITIISVILLLLLMYSIPKIINRIKSPKVYKEMKNR